ncbi:MAG: GspH/FimT family pseudopilin [Nitrospirota bacterium]
MKFFRITYHASRITSRRGFTLLELIIVMFLVSLMLGLSTVLLVNALPSSNLDATAREVSAVIRYARSLAVISGERQVMTLDMDAKRFGIEGRGSKAIPPEVAVSVVDPAEGTFETGQYRFVFRPIGAAEGGTIVLANPKRTVRIETDPVIGAVTIK